MVHPFRDGKAKTPPFDIFHPTRVFEGLPFGNIYHSTVEKSVTFIKFYFKNGDSGLSSFWALGPCDLTTLDFFL